jgi:hypothetical protein
VCPALPVQSLYHPTFNGKDFRVTPIVQDIDVSYAISTMLAEVGVLSASTVTWPGEIGESGIVKRQFEEGKDGRGAEGAGRLFTAVDAVAVVKLNRRWGRGSELDGAALAGNVHDKRYCTKRESHRLGLYREVGY